MPGNTPDRPDSELVAADLASFLDTAAKQTWPTKENTKPVKNYRIALGWEPIELGNVEFHILLFLASRPYHAFSIHAISEAVGTSLEPIDVAEIDMHIKSLRDQLGVFHDYVQTVPGVGYRFKQ